MYSTLLKKLSRLTFQELSARTKALVSSRVDEMRYMTGLRDNPHSELLDGIWNDGAAFGENPWMSEQDHLAVVAYILKRDEAYVKQIRRAADKLCEGRFVFFGKPVQYRDGVSWCADPISGKPWPMKFHTRVDIFGGDTGCGDVKYVWELNRHQFLVTLGKAYCLTGDEKYAEHGLHLIEEWINSNPYKVGINWTSGLEVAIRGLSWCWACAFFKASKALTKDRKKAVVLSLAQHGQWVAGHLSYFFSPYNHLIGEATALFVMGSVLPWLRSSECWRKRGWEILVRELPRQFFADGGTVEQATGYHHFTVGFYLQAFLRRKKLGVDIPSSLWQVFERCFEYSMYLTKPDGQMPMIGDGDEGKAFDLTQDNFWNVRPFLAIGAVLFGRGDMKMIAGALPTDVLWLVGPDAWDAYQRLSDSPPKSTSKALRDSGYYIMRTGWDEQAHYASMDCGIIAHGVHEDELVSAAHGHADALSLEVSSHGKSIIIDPGFYTYNGSVKWHRYFRETQGHNTVVADGHSQAEYRGRLKWSHGPAVQTHYWMSSNRYDYVEGEHRGYARFPGNIVHRRSLLFIKPDLWVVRDEVIGEGEHELDQLFHFAPVHVTYDKKKKSVLAKHATGEGVMLLPLEYDSVKLKLSTGGKEPGDGWIAVGYEQKVSAPLALFRRRAMLPVAFHTLIVPFHGTTPAVQARVLPGQSTRLNGEPTVLTIQSGSIRDIVIFSAMREVKSFFEGWATDARMACWRLEPGGALICAGIVGGSYLKKNGEDVLTMQKPIQFGALMADEHDTTIELSEPTHVRTRYANPRLVVNAL